MTGATLHLARIGAIIALGLGWFWLVDRFVTRPGFLDENWGGTLGLWPPSILFFREVLIWANDHTQEQRRPLRDASAALGLRNWQVGDVVTLPRFEIIEASRVVDYFSGHWQGVPVQLLCWEWQSVKGGGGRSRLVLLVAYRDRNLVASSGRDGSTWSFECAGPFVAVGGWPRDFAPETLRAWLDAALEEAHRIVASTPGARAGQGVAVEFVGLKLVKRWLRRIVPPDVARYA